MASVLIQSGRRGRHALPGERLRYQEIGRASLRCLDLDEEAPLPAELTKGTKTYRHLKEAKS